jgi:prophage maintenance system killer protein
MSEIKFLTLTQILTINKIIEIKTKKHTEIKYVRRFVPINTRKNLEYLVDCAKEYYYKTNDIRLTAAYYLKNIIILQAMEDANHRTAITATTIFLNSNGYNTKKVTTNCYFSFKSDLLMYRTKEYYTFKSLMADVLKFEDNTVENDVFNYCLKFIKNKILR